MSQDPYSVLEVTYGAGMEEVTAAYRKLAKKYHPDLNPGDKKAELKMRQINAAYEEIKNEKTGGPKYEQSENTNRGGNPFGGGFEGFDDIFGRMFGGQRPQYRSSLPPLEQVVLLLQNHQYRDAEMLLSTITNRNAQWHYLSAHAHAGLGNRVSALNHASEAIRLEPGNMEYRRLLSHLKQSGSNYTQTGQSRGYSTGSIGRSILNIILMQLACCFCCRCC